MRKLIFGSVTIVVVAVVAYVLRLLSLQEKLQLFTSVVPSAVALDGMQLRVRVTAKNPTRHRLSITNPFVSLYVPGEEAPFASSNPTPGVVTFEPDSSNTFDIRIEVRYADALPAVRKIITAGRIEVETMARFGPFKALSFSDRQTVEFRQIAQNNNRAQQEPERDNPFRR